MADHNQPTLSSQYSDFLSAISGRIVDAISLHETPTNPPTGAIRWNRTDDKFQEWSGAWIDQLLSLAGGGTGANTASGARTNLGLGSVAVQNDNAVNITGGSISGLASLGVSGNTIINGRLDVNSGAVNALEVTGGIRAGSGNIDIIGTDGRIPALSSTYFASLTALGNWTFGAALTVNSKITITDSVNDPELVIRDDGSAVDEKLWRVVSAGGDLLIQTINDAVSSTVTAIAFRRDGNLCNQIELPSVALGDGVVAPALIIGRNTTDTGAPGCLGLMDETGTIWYLFFDNSGVLRRANFRPNENQIPNLVGVVIGDQVGP